MSGFSSFFFYLKSKGKKQRLRLQFSANAQYWHGPKIMVSLYSFQTPCFDMLTGHLASVPYTPPQMGRTDYEKLLTFTPLGKYNWCTLISQFVFIFRLNLLRDRQNLVEFRSTLQINKIHKLSIFINRVNTKVDWPSHRDWKGLSVSSMIRLILQQISGFWFGLVFTTRSFSCALGGSMVLTVSFRRRVI